MKKQRIIKVRIPDDDSAERVIRYAAKQLNDGQELVVLDYSSVIPRDHTAVMVNRLATYIRVTEAKFRAKLFEVASSGN